MSNWNWAYTKRKQKEMTQNSISDSTKELKPLYRELGYYNTDSYQKRRQEQIKKDRFAWKVGIFIMTIISIVGTYAIYWAATTSY